MPDTTPRHSRRRTVSKLRALMGAGRVHVAPTAEQAASVIWSPLPLDADVAGQARRELDALAAARRQDVWAGSRDTDRSL